LLCLSAISNGGTAVPGAPTTVANLQLMCDSMSVSFTSWWRAYQTKHRNVAPSSRSTAGNETSAPKVHRRWKQFGNGESPGSFSFLGVGALHKPLTFPVAIKAPLPWASESCRGNCRVTVCDALPHFPPLLITLDSAAVGFWPSRPSAQTPMFGAGILDAFCAFSSLRPLI
jgi:hypothetical protein